MVALLKALILAPHRPFSAAAGRASIAAAGAIDASAIEDEFHPT